jgi:flagellin
MAITINTNVSAMVAQRNLAGAAAASGSSLAKLSSGSRVPTAKDDAAALAIGSRLTTEVAGLRQAALNAGQASSMLQIADGAMGQISDILVRMQSLAVQAKSGQLSSTERNILDAEFKQLQGEVDRISGDTKFNGVTLLSGGSLVTADRNGLSTSVVNSANGFDSFRFDNDFGTGAIKVGYVSSTRVMTLTNLDNGATESVDLSGVSIAGGSTYTASFDTLGVTVNLNENFNFSSDIAQTNTSVADIEATDVTAALDAAAVGFTNGNSRTLDATTFAITNVGGDVEALQYQELDGAVLSIDATTAASSVLTLTGVTGHTFTASATGNFGGANDAITFFDQHGNQVDVDLTFSGALADGDAIFIDVSADHTPTVSNIQLGTIDVGANVDADHNLFGRIASGTIAFSAMGTANNATATLSFVDAQGTTHNLQDTSVNLTGTGTVSMALTLADLGVLDADGGAVLNDDITVNVSFDVDSVFANNDTFEINLAELGQTVGASAGTSTNTSFTFQIGTGTNSAQDELTVAVSSVNSADLGISTSDVNILDETSAAAAITAIEGAVTTLNTARANVGAAQSRLDFAAANLAVAQENNAAARSALLDVDVSMEMTEFTSKQVLIQAGVSMLAQANQQPALLLRLLQ